jgi:glycosyltransferase involved in cell wall biosynthesis
MPCLNEETSVGLCVQKAWEGIRLTGLKGEVIVSDNGSTDGSVAVARAAGARVIHQPLRGYGNAYLAGFAAARGSIIAMGDSDDSYDFTALPQLIGPLSEGYDYVLGSRLSGRIQPGAMPWTHRYIGNPILTRVLNILFKLRVSDAHSGFRVFTREALGRMQLQCEGMEFASEIVVKAARAELNITEVPITYHPRIGQSKLNSVIDGWRHLRFLLLLSPKFLFIVPGLAVFVAGLLGVFTSFGLSGKTSLIVFKVLFAFAVVIGMQLLVLGSAATARTVTMAFGIRNRLSDWVIEGRATKQGFAIGTAVFSVGFAMLLYRQFVGWGSIRGGGLSTSLFILSILLTTLGITLWFDAFFLGLFEAKNDHRQAFEFMTPEKEGRVVFLERRQQSRRRNDIELAPV